MRGLPRSRHVWFFVAAFACAFLNSHVALSQGRSEWIIDPQQDMHTWLRHIEGRGIGDIAPYSSAGATTHFFVDNGALLFDAQFLLTNDADEGGNFGMYRRTFVGDSIVGIGLWYDLNRSRYHHLFQQLSVNIELLRDDWSVRANGYLPVGPHLRETVVNQSPLMLNDTAVGRDVTILQENAMDGFDVELARRFAAVEAEVFVGFYHFEDENVDTSGIKAGVRNFLTPNLAAEVTVSNDPLFGTNLFGGLTLFFDPVDGRIAPQTLQDKLLIPVERNPQVVVNESREVRFVQQDDQPSGDPLYVFFVEEGGSGDGSQANPTSLAVAQSAPEFGAGSVIVLLNSAGAITQEMVFDDSRQQLVGAGNTGEAIVSFALSTGNSADVLTFTGLGTRPTLEPTTPVAVQLDSGSSLSNLRVMGIAVDGAGGAGVGIGQSVAGVATTNTVIEDVMTQNLTTAGIQIQNPVDLAISNFSSDGDAAGISLGSGGEITGTIALTNVEITDAATDGVVLANAQMATVVTAANLTVSGRGATSGVSIIDTANDTGGTFTFDSNSRIQNVDGTAFFVNGNGVSSPIVTYSGTITNTLGDAIAIHNTTAGNTISFDSMAMNAITDSGSGIVMNNIAGNVNFQASLLVTGTEGLDIDDSSGAITFSDITANGVTNDVVNVLNSTGNMTFGTLNVDGASRAVFLSGNSGTMNFITLDAQNLTNDGVKVVNSAAGSSVVFGTLNIDTASHGIFLSGNSGSVSFTTVTANNLTNDGVHVVDSASGSTSVFSSLNVDRAMHGVFLSGNSGNFSVSGGTLRNLSIDGIRIADDGGVTSISGLTADAAASNGLAVLNHTSTATLNVNNSIFSNHPVGILLDVSAGGTLILSGAGNSFLGNTSNCITLQGTGTFNGFLDFGPDGTCP